MKKTMIALGLVALLILGAAYVYAKGQEFGPGHKGEPCSESSNPGKWSSLTQEQKTKSQELRQKFNEETAQLRGALLTKRLELQSLWRNPKADSKTIMEKERELRNLQNQMKDKVVQNMLEARKLLTPEQLAEFGPGGRMGSGFHHGHMMGDSNRKGCRGPGMGMWQ
jgi:Spy/CpxP family protein refolding chaperone